jgi:hypothetical protein
MIILPEVIDSMITYLSCPEPLVNMLALQVFVYACKAGNGME